MEKVEAIKSVVLNLWYSGTRTTCEVNLDGTHFKEICFWLKSKN